MPALTQRVGRVHRFFHMSFKPKPCDEYRDLQIAKTDPKIAKTDPSGFSLLKLANTMRRGSFGIDEIRRVRKSGCTFTDVQNAFQEYLKQLPSSYSYGDYESPFDDPVGSNRIGAPNCHARAKGFLQLMAACGVPLENLGYAEIGSSETPTSKVVRKNRNHIDSRNVWTPQWKPRESAAPNAVRATLDQRNNLKVVRTTREPFNNHVCAFVEVTGDHQYWDPLFGRAYKNGMQDYFDSVEVNPDNRYKLPSSADTIRYMDPHEQRRRLYRFETSRSAGELGKSEVYKAVESEKGAMSSDDRSVFLVIDESDWPDTLKPGMLGMHPPVVEKIFGLR